MGKPRTNCRTSREQDSVVPSSLPGEPQLVRGEKVSEKSIAEHLLPLDSTDSRK